MTATSFNPRALLAKSRLGVLATLKADGRPQLSPVMPSYDEETGVIRISTTEATAKTTNLRRDPRAALEVTSADGIGAGLSRLRDALARPAPSLEATCDSVLEALLPARPPDDVALLLARTRALGRS